MKEREKYEKTETVDLNFFKSTIRININGRNEVDRDVYYLFCCRKRRKKAVIYYYF